MVLVLDLSNSLGELARDKHDRPGRGYSKFLWHEDQMKANNLDRTKYQSSQSKQTLSRTSLWWGEWLFYSWRIESYVRRSRHNPRIDMEGDPVNIGDKIGRCHLESKHRL